MGKFILGALTVFLLYNQDRVRRGYYIVTYELHLADRLVQEKSPIVRKAWADVQAPLVETSKEVREPTLDDLQKLGFNVKKQ